MLLLRDTQWLVRTVSGMTQVIGKTARFARIQQGKAVRQAALWLVVMLGAAVVGLGPGLIGGLQSGFPPVRTLLLLGGLGVGVWAGTKFKTFQAAAGRQRRGVQAEQLVVRAVRGRDVPVVMNGVEVGRGGDADHVVVVDVGGLGAVVVVETKAGGGSVRSDRRGGLFTGQRGRRIPGDPVGQVLRQVSGVEAVLGLKAEGVVCVTGMSSPPFEERGVVICGADDLRKVLRAKARYSLPADVVDYVTGRLTLKD